MGFVVTILLIYFAFILLWPYIKRWVQRRAARMMQDRMDDMLRSAMGMPPRDKKSAKKQRRTSKSSDRTWTRTTQQPHSHTPHDSIIPHDYADDVEFVEIKEFSESVSAAKDDNITWQQEEQVVDVEWEEIKETKSKK